MLLKQRSLSLPRNLALRAFGKLSLVFSTKVNLLYLLYSTAQRCCFLHLVKQHCLLKTFVRTQILMTQGSLLCLICGNNLNWLLNLNLIYEALWTRASSGLLISLLGKLNWFHLTSLVTLVLLM